MRRILLQLSSRKLYRDRPECKKKKKSKPLPVTSSSSSSSEEDDGSTAMKKTPKTTKFNRQRRALEVAENAALGIKTKQRKEYGSSGCKVCGSSLLIHPHFHPYHGARYCPKVNTDISWEDWKKLIKEAASREEEN